MFGVKLLLDSAGVLHEGLILGPQARAEPPGAAAAGAETDGGEKQTQEGPADENHR